MKKPFSLHPAIIFLLRVASTIAASSDPHNSICFGNHQPLAYPKSVDLDRVISPLAYSGAGKRQALVS